MQNYLHAPQQDFLHKFNHLSDILIDDNYSNIKNLNQSNHNFQQTFNYLRSILKEVIAEHKMLQSRNMALEEQLARIQPNHPLLYNRSRPQLNFGDPGLRFSLFTPLTSRKADSFSKKLQPQTLPAKKSKQLNERLLMREQFSMIEQFISKHLVTTLSADRSKKKSIPKNVIMNLYLRWNEARGRRILLDKAKVIKTHITQQLKRQFPYMDHNENNYRGIEFKQHIVQDPPPVVDELVDIQFGHDQIQNEDQFNLKDLEL